MLRQGAMFVCVFVLIMINTNYMYNGYTQEVRAGVTQLPAVRHA